MDDFPQIRLFPRICLDRHLPSVMEPEAARRAVLENPANAPMAMASPVEAALLTGKKWAPGRVLRCKFLAGVPGVRDGIIQAAKQWEKYANITFDFSQDWAEADIRIDASYNPADGSWSVLGTDALLVGPTEPTMRLGWLTPTSSPQDYSSVVGHEFGHVLGLFHEHQNPAGGIQWNVPQVDKDLGGPPNNWDLATIQTNIFDTYSKDLSQYTQTDSASIMLYAIPAAWTLNGFSSGWNTQISATDGAFIATQYPKPVGPDPGPAPVVPPVIPPAPAPGPAPLPVTHPVTALFLNSRLTRGQIDSGGVAYYEFELQRGGGYAVIVAHTSGAGLLRLELRPGTIQASPVQVVRGNFIGHLDAGRYFLVISAADGRSPAGFMVGVRMTGGR